MNQVSRFFFCCMNTLGAGRFRMFIRRGGDCAAELPTSGVAVGRGLSEAEACGLALDCVAACKGGPGSLAGEVAAGLIPGLAADDDVRAGEALEGWEPERWPEVIARSLASLSANDGVTTGLWILDSEKPCILDLPGALIDGTPGGGSLRGRDVGGGGGGRLCSSTSERGAFLTCEARLLSCLVGTARTVFRFVAANILFFFFDSRGSCGRSKVHLGALRGSNPAPPAERLGPAKTGLMPPTLRSNDAYRCLAVGRKRGRGISRRSVTNLALFFARSDLIPFMAIIIFSASSSTARWTRSRSS